LKKNSKKIVRQNGGMKEITEEEKTQLKSEILKILNDYMSLYLKNVKALGIKGQILLPQIKTFLSMNYYYVDINILHSLCSLLLKTYDIENVSSMSKTMRGIFGKKTIDDSLQFLYNILKTQTNDERLPKRINKLVNFINTNIYNNSDGDSDGDSDGYTINLIYMEMINLDLKRSKTSSAVSNDAKELEDEYAKIEKELKLKELKEQLDLLKSKVREKLTLIRGINSDERFKNTILEEILMIKSEGEIIEKEIKKITTELKNSSDA
jgi:hypothetical protein